MARKPVMAATPFDGLLGHKPAKVPTTKSQRLVVAGKVVEPGTRLPDLALRLTADTESVPQVYDKLRKAVTRTYHQARYQRVNDTPEEKAKRKAWQEAHKEERREYLRKWRKKHAKKNREYQAEWARKNYHADPEAGRRKQREWYAANREKVLAKLKAQRDAKKAAKSADTSTQTNQEGTKHEQQG